MSSLTISSQRKEEIAVLAVARRFLGGLKARDPASMHSCTLPTSHALLIRPSPDARSGKTPSSSQLPKQILHLTLAQVVDRIPWDSPESIEENIARADWEEGDDGDKYGGRKTEVRVDGDLAMVWTPYEVRKDGLLTHNGTNVFTFAKDVHQKLVDMMR